MAIFRTPTDNFVTPVIAEFDVRWHRPSEEQRLANRLARHRAPTARGRNVYLLNNGTFTETEPSNMGTVARVYYGGHDIEVTAEEVAALTAAGYGSNISG